MDKVILIKYGELTTKKGNRNFFMQTLYQNISHKLKKFKVKIHYDRARMYIEFLDCDLEKIQSIIDKIFGIHMYHIATIVHTNIEEIKQKALEIVQDFAFSTFKVETMRSDKTFELNSLECSRILGGVILKNLDGISVDVHHPDLTLHVEIREKYSYLYVQSYQGSGGYPVGTQPLGLLMLSGGIDSPVSGYLAMKRGILLDAVYFEAIPHTSMDARNKVIDLVKKLSCYTYSIRLHIVNFTPIQEAIYQHCKTDYCITIMRRMMYRIMEKLAINYRAFAIINGESIGQVASQTLPSMSVVNQVTSMPVIRPVACLDKLEIIDLAKKIDTYDISILPFEDCCTVFVPKHPVIHPKLSVAIQEEEKFSYQEMIDDAVLHVKTICISDDEVSEFSKLL